MNKMFKLGDDVGSLHSMEPWKEDEFGQSSD